MPRRDLPTPRLLVSFTELKGKLRPETRRPPQVPHSVRGRARIWTKVSSLPDPVLPPHRAPPPPSGTGTGTGGRRRRRGGKGLTNPSTWGKCVCGGGGGSYIHSPPPDLRPSGRGRCRTSGSLGRGCNTSDGRGSPVWGSPWAGGREAGSQQLLAQVSARHDCGLDRDPEPGSLRALCARGSLEGPGGEEQAPAGHGETAPQASGFTVNLVHLWPMQGCSPKGSPRGRACRGPRGLCGFCASPPARPQAPPPDSAHPESPRDPAFCGQLCQ